MSPHLPNKLHNNACSHGGRQSPTVNEMSQNSSGFILNHRIISTSNFLVSEKSSNIDKQEGNGQKDL